MACMTHECRDCGDFVFNNSVAPEICSRCGGRAFVSYYDEEDSEHDYRLERENKEFVDEEEDNEADA